MFTSACAIAGAVCFGLGTIFGKHIVSETVAIKAHTTAEMTKLRADLAHTLQQFKAKL